MDPLSTWLLMIALVLASLIPPQESATMSEDMTEDEYIETYWIDWDDTRFDFPEDY